MDSVIDFVFSTILLPSNPQYLLINYKWTVDLDLRLRHSYTLEIFVLDTDAPRISIRM